MACGDDCNGLGASCDGSCKYVSHPENIDPPWFQELVRRAYDRKLTELINSGTHSDQALEDAMWYVFELRNNLTELYKAGGAQ